ncbi:MAG TPA: amidase, partial [Myxococcota bacterium]|nr:amidase [Myxococcota bacterium]
RLRRGALGAEEHVAACLADIGRSPLNAFVRVYSERARAEAAALDRARQAGAEPGPLFGLAVAVKDNLDEAGQPCAAGCRAYRARVPGEDAEAVRRLRAAGAVIVGRTGMHELADGVTSENPWTGPVHNPCRLGFHPGGSSGGSAAAVGAGLVPAALGTDTGGSVRIPASLCGVVGFKPSHGLLPTAGVVPLSTSLDHLGVLTGNVAGAGLVAEALAGPAGQGLAAAARAPRGVLRLGVLEGLGETGTGPDLGVAAVFAEALARLGRAGFGQRPVRVAGFERALAVMSGIYAPEMAAAHTALLAGPPEDLSPEVRADLERGRAAPPEKLAQAQARRGELALALEAALAGADLLVLPTTPHPARPFGSPRPHTYLLYTCAFNLSGQPAVSLPMGQVDGLPVGLQLVGPRGGDALLLAAAAAAERALADA